MKTSATIESNAPVMPRREPALLAAMEEHRKSFGRFCAEIDRLRCLTPTQVQVARLLALATLRQGFNSIAFGSLNELMHLRSGRYFRGIGPNDLSPAVNGSPQTGRLGLKHFGIVQVDERAALESAMPVTVWLLIADAAQWSGVPAEGWASTPAEDAEWLESVRACRRRHTPPLSGMGAEADLHDARAMLGAAQVTDAPERSLRAAERTPRACRSESQNAYSRENTRCVPKVRTGHVQRLNREQVNRTGKQLNCSGARDDSNRLLELLRIELVRCHGEADAASEMERSGAHWRKVARTWPEMFEGEIAALRDHIRTGGQVVTAWSFIRHYMLRRLDCSSWPEAFQKKQGIS